MDSPSDSDIPAFSGTPQYKPEVFDTTQVTPYLIRERRHWRLWTDVNYEDSV
jgi:hypothetical protein